MAAYGAARKSSESGSKSAWTGQAGWGWTAMARILPARARAALVARRPARHALEQLGPAQLGPARVELAVRRLDVDRDPLRVAPPAKSPRSMSSAARAASMPASKRPFASSRT